MASRTEHYSDERSARVNLIMATTEFADLVNRLGDIQTRLATDLMSADDLEFVAQDCNYVYLGVDIMDEMRGFRDAMVEGYEMELTHEDASELYCYLNNNASLSITSRDFRDRGSWYITFSMDIDIPEEAASLSDHPEISDQVDYNYNFGGY